jgi:hypothetical protein
MDTKGILEIIQRNGKNHAGSSPSSKSPGGVLLSPRGGLEAWPGRQGARWPTSRRGHVLQGHHLKPKAALHIGLPRNGRATCAGSEDRRGILAGARHKTGETTPDNEITSRRSTASGACALAPSCSDAYFANVPPGRSGEILLDTREGTFDSDGSQETEPDPDRGVLPRFGRSLMDSGTSLQRPRVHTDHGFDERQDRMGHDPHSVRAFFRTHEHTFPPTPSYSSPAPTALRPFPGRLRCVDLGPRCNDEARRQ